MISKIGPWKNRNTWDHKIRSFIPGIKGADLRREKEREKERERMGERGWEGVSELAALCACSVLVLFCEFFF